MLTLSIESSFPEWREKARGMPQPRFMRKNNHIQIIYLITGDLP